MWVRRFLLFLGHATLAPLALLAQVPAVSRNLGDLDIEQLAQIRVTSVARRPEALGQAPAAIFVITREDIRRSGAVSLPEALRLAPGLQVARVGSREWAISSRGFNERASNKLLVQLDGRAVYSPVFAGVNWDVQDVPLVDIERIEVILGPGATLWGSNAVNGVINVITRSAIDTRNGVVDVSVGTEARVAATLRQGVAVAPGVAARVFGRYLDYAPTELLGDGEASDDWQFGHGGVRLDADAGERDGFTVIGDAFVGSGGELFQLPASTPPFSARFDEDVDVHGGSILGRWNHKFATTSDLTFQAYFDRAVRKQPAFLGRMRVDLLDFDLQHHLQLGRRQDLVWGVGYRRNADEITGSYVISFVPPGRATSLVTAFFQDDIAVTPTQWRLTVGTKLEHNTFSGWEVQPNVRLRWLPNSRHALWAAVSRAVRIPSRVDADLDEIGAIIPGTPPILVSAEGNDAFHAERLVAYELGYRTTPTAHVSIDAALYYNDYDRLRTFDPLPTTFEDGFAILPLTFGNQATGRTYGGTLATSWRPVRSLRLDASYTYLNMRIETLPGVLDATSDTRPDLNPSHEASLRSALTLPHDIDLDLSLRYVSDLSDVPEYLQGDARLGWHPRPELELAIVGKDLLSPRHLEFASPSFLVEMRQIPRRGLLQLRWRF